MLSNALLIVIKLIVAGSTGAVSVLAEAVHSCGDLIGAVISMMSVRISDTPPDQDHEYGHGKFENLSGIAIAVLVFGAGAYAAAEAIEHLRHQHKGTTYTFGLAVMAVSFVVNLVVSQHLLSVGKETDSPALMSDGVHLRTDVFTSLAVFVSLLLVQITGLGWIDSTAALGVSLMIFWIAGRLLRDAIATLSDASLPLSEHEALRDVLVNDPRVLGYHNLRTRKSGSHRHIDVHVQASDTHTFVQAHDLTEDLEEKLRQTLPNVHPIIHIEPYDAESAHQRQEHGRDLNQAP